MENKSRGQISRLDCLTESPVVDFYDDKSVLITGATGFIGKVSLSREFLYFIRENFNETFPDFSSSNVNNQK